MNPAKVLVVTILAGSLSIGIALYGERWLDVQTPSSGVGKAAARGLAGTLPELRLPDLSGREVSPDSWAGKVVVLNYWATWCPPCLREMPMLVELQRTYDDGELQVVGIAIDQPEQVQRFLDEHEINYPILLGGTEAIEAAQKLGNRTQGLPFTVIFDALGRRVFSQTGEISAATLREELLPLLPPPQDQTPSTGTATDTSRQAG
jgi:thiol-disulfide isomerase/thioredoxin